MSQKPNHSLEVPNNPKLFIVDYYDQLIRKIDIDTESKLKVLKRNDEITSQHLESVRTKMIELLNKACDENIKHYVEVVSSRQELSTADDDEHQRRNNKEKVEYLKSKLFRDKYCFILREATNEMDVLNSNLFVLDFYVCGKVPGITK